MMRSLVSIITPSFNQSSFLEQTICSVLEQGYPHIEYIVVDGGSTDGSVEIVKKYADQFAWWVSEKDAGQAEAINKGLARAQGEIIAWLNSDDYYLPGVIAEVVSVFEENPDVVMVYGDMLAVDERGQTINELKYKQLSLEDLLCFQIIGQPAVFFRRATYEKTGGLNTAFHFLLDHQFWIRVTQHGKILHIPQTWAAARYHEGAKNRAKAVEFGREAFHILDWARMQPSLVEAVLNVERRARASAHRVNARYLLDGGQPVSALDAWMRALFIHPPTALARLNIFGVAVLSVLGLRSIQKVYLNVRKKILEFKNNDR